jgi:uncharacterized protein YegP (UPF0339 family)
VASDSHFLNRQGSGFVAKNPVRGHGERTAPGESGQCRFSIFRIDEVGVTSTRFVGGDWRWRLSDPNGATLVEGGGYRKEAHCRRAVALLQAGAARATVV